MVRIAGKRGMTREEKKAYNRRKSLERYWRLKNDPKFKEQKRLEHLRWARNNPEKIRKNRKTHYLKRRTIIGLDPVVREKYLKYQMAYYFRRKAREAKEIEHLKVKWAHILEPMKKKLA